MCEYLKYQKEYVVFVQTSKKKIRDSKIKEDRKNLYRVCIRK